MQETPSRSLLVKVSITQKDQCDMIPLHEDPGVVMFIETGSGWWVLGAGEGVGVSAV